MGKNFFYCINIILITFITLCLTSCQEQSLRGGQRAAQPDNYSEVPYDPKQPYLIDTKCGLFCYEKNPAIYLSGQEISFNDPKTISTGPFSYSITPALPDGLFFDTTIGRISGTPQNILSATNYTITQNSPSGSIDTILQITVLNSMQFKNIKFNERYSKDFGQSVLVQPDGKIVILAKSCRDAWQCAISAFSLIRLNSDSTLDTTFNSTGKVYTKFTTGLDLPIAMALQSDGKIVVAGKISHDIDGSHIVIVRYNTNGTLDGSFNKIGYTTIGMGYKSDIIVANLVLQNDGKILIAGSSTGKSPEFYDYDFLLLRLKSNGILDENFNKTGTIPGIIRTHLGSNFDITKNITIQNLDGKIILVGNVDGINGNKNFAIIRFNSNGTIDSSFNPSGQLPGSAIVDLNNYDDSSSVVLQETDKIILAGTTLVSSLQKITMIRFNPDGSLDSSFGINGIQIQSVGSNPTSGKVYLKTDENLLWAGQDYFNNTGKSNFFLAQFNKVTGSLDSNFNSSGFVSINIDNRSGASGLVLQPDGKFILTGYAQPINNLNPNFTYDVPTNIATIRLNTNGSLDTSFGTNGKVLTNIGGVDSNDVPYGNLTQTNGKLIIFGSTNQSGNEDFAIARFNPDGNLDETFNSNGKVVLDLGTNSFDIATSSAQQNDEKLLVAGLTKVKMYQDVLSLVRLNPDGNLDLSFNSTGKILTNFISSTSHISVQKDDKIILAGSYGPKFLIYRYYSNGILDNSFNSTGIVELQFDGNEKNVTLQHIMIQNDGKILLAGITPSSTGLSNIILARLNSDGHLDLSFNSIGYITTQLSSNSNDIVKSVHVQTDGKIVLIGDSNYGNNNGFIIIRYNQDGSRDTSFNDTGLKIIDLGLSSVTYKAVYSTEENSKILFSGIVSKNNSSTSPPLGIFIRLNSDGTYDNTFYNTGKFQANFGLFFNNENIIFMDHQDNGTFLVFGASGQAGNSDFSFLSFK